MKVTMIAYTSPAAPFLNLADEVGFQRDCIRTSGAEQLIEFAGRNCYQSWSNPGKKTNAEYIRNILDHGHGSVLEHASATFYITGVSRSLTHELIRHRHLSFSELSQRYVNVESQDFVLPPALDGQKPAWWDYCTEQRARDSYQLLANHLEHTKGLQRKQAREAARAVMPNCTETKIVVSGNFRAWRAFIDSRANEHADAEICLLAVEIARQLKDRFPNAFQDYEFVNGYAWTHNRKV